MQKLQKHFEKFLNKIDFDKTQYINEVINLEMCLSKLDKIRFARRSGSTKRGTSVKSKSDVDFIIILDKDKVKNLTVTNFFNVAFQEIKQCINDLNANTKGDHGFSCSRNNITIDLVIGYQDSNDMNLFRIPEIVNNSWVWIETKQITLEQRMKKAKDLTSGKAQNYVKLLKFWNYTYGKKFTSFYLETLVVNKILSDSEKFKSISYGEGVKELFLHLSKAIYEKASHPSGKGPRIAKMDEKERMQLRDYLVKFYNRARVGLDPKNRNSMNNWRNIFGKSFGA